MSLYAASFALLLAAVTCFVIAALAKLTDSSLRLLRVSAVLSVLAIVVAVVSVLVPRRR